MAWLVGHDMDYVIFTNPALQPAKSLPYKHKNPVRFLKPDRIESWLDIYLSSKETELPDNWLLKLLEAQRCIFR